MTKNTPHKLLSNSEELQNEISSSQSGKKDRKPMARLLIIALFYLNAVPIYVYPNIIGLFANYGIKKRFVLLELIKKFNFSIKENILNDRKFLLEDWNNKRALNKSNKYEKNIILCVFLLTFYEQFIHFLGHFLEEIKVNKKNKDALIFELKQIYDMVFVTTRPNIIDYISDDPQNGIPFDYFEETDSNDLSDDIYNNY